METNPFYPSFGATPEVLVGRDEALQDFAYTFAGSGPGAPGLTTLISGARGMGKTTLLTMYRQAAESEGWLSIEETGRPGLVHRLAATHLPALLRRADPTGFLPRLTSLGFSAGGTGGSVTWEQRYPVELTLRRQVEDLVDGLRPSGRGLAITLDEVTAATADDMREIGELAQFARTSRRLLAVAATGLTSEIDDFLELPGTTFLRRAERHLLDAIADSDAIADAITATVTRHGRVIHPEAARLAAIESRGYPFLIQKIGYEAWRRAPEGQPIDLGTVAVAADEARRRMGDAVHSVAVRGLTDVERAVLLAMAADGEGPSRTQELARRLDVSPQYLNNYRVRLIDKGLIESAGQGFVRYTLPYLGEYLRSVDAAGGALPSPGPRAALEP